MANYEEMDFRKFTGRSETDKAINTLKGILLGINLDGKINALEIRELQGWCKEHGEMVNRHPFTELVSLIQEGTSSGLEGVDWIEDLLYLCNQTGEGSLYYDMATADLQTLQGMCHGILSDGQVDDTEVNSLREWLDEHEHLAKYYPYDEIHSLVLCVLSDGIIDDKERLRLKAHFNQFVKLSDSELTEKIAFDTASIKIEGICTANPEIDFDGKTFCLTGLFDRGTRKEAEAAVADMGGIVTKDVSKKTDYLIVGQGGSPCWSFEAFGRKVQKAQTYRREGSKVSIIAEYDFWDILEGAQCANKVNANQ
ncbi:BRCT domain-containing protein [Rufibacter latericius]|uniref:BRCT domain-containing protein n=1 Tax=Rufibacter latericius TaxID=2487040 RepID=A0A3M9MG47_9BACT|nr:BRCT domain-containing protein [Rufibacter latericius]RNI24165.1 hypothetical protein EFB08_17485 [Rufibacter latericius]